MKSEKKRKSKSHGSRRDRLERARLYLIFVPSLCSGNPFETLEAALRGGVDIVQVRAKDAPSRELLELSHEVKRIIAGRALLIINDRPDIAALSDADGVHLGQEDLPVSAARSLLGSERLIGLSTHSLTQLKEGQKSSADYLGFGPIFPSSTKGYSHGVGESELAAFQRWQKRPVFLLGGITPENLEHLRLAKRVAVASAILCDPSPTQAVRDFRKRLK